MMSLESNFTSQEVVPTGDVMRNRSLTHGPGGLQPGGGGEEGGSRRSKLQVSDEESPRFGYVKVKWTKSFVLSGRIIKDVMVGAPAQAYASVIININDPTNITDIDPI